MVSIPTIQQLYASILADLQTEFGVSINPTGKAFLRGFAATQAAKLKLQYLGLGNVQKNIWPDLADPEALGGTLERFGRIKGLLPFPASQGQYTVAVTGTAGSVINASVTFKSDDSSLNPGYIYILDNAYTLTGSGDTITLRCLTGGTAALLAVGNTLTCTQPIVGVNASVAVTAISTSPIDAETVEEYRARIEETYVLEPQGGAASDYRLWGREAAGVAQIYPYVVSGISNTVATYVEAILSDSTDGKGTPTTTIINEVVAIMAASNGLKPLGVMPVQVLPVTIATIDIQIPGTTAAMTGAQRSLITTGLRNALAAIRPFIGGVDNPAAMNNIISINVIVSSILNSVPGSIFTAPVLLVNSIPMTTYTFDFGVIPYLNSVIFP